MALKYFEGIRAAQAAGQMASPGGFDIQRMRTTGLKGRLVSRFLENPRWALALLRRFRPILTVGRFVLVTRNDDVREVLERQDAFQTPFGPEMSEMAGGANFILGMQDGPAYRRMKSALLSAFPPDEVEAVVRPIARRHAQRMMLGETSGFDPVSGMLRLVPALICRDYFGLLVDDESAFADWSIALSGLFFADPTGNAVTRELAAQAARNMLAVIDRSIDAARDGRIDPETPLARLLTRHQRHPGDLSIAEIRSIMMGMVAGFCPTNLLAAGNALDVILTRREAQSAVEGAISAGDDRLLDKAILEAMRFKPINVGPFRHVPADAVIADGTPRRRVIKAGSLVVPATLSAMFDPEAIRDPETYDPTRLARDYLVFGHGIHWCIGSAIARVQIAECFRVLFSRTNLRRAPGRKGRLRRLGAFPESLHVAFDPQPGNGLVDHGFVTVVVPISKDKGVSLDVLRESLAEHGNPASGPLAAALDRSGTIHFASMAVACRADPDAEQPDDEAYLVIEINGDGSSAELLEHFAAHGGEHLAPLLRQAGVDIGEDGVPPVLRAHAVTVSPALRHTAGLVFSGTPGHSVKRIHAEARLEERVGAIVRDAVRASPTHAMAVLEETRARLIEEGGHDWALEPAESLLEKKGSSFQAMLVRLLRSPILLASLIALLVFTTWTNYVFVFGRAADSAIGTIMMIGASSLLGIFGTIIVAGIALGALLLAVRRLERSDVPTSETLSIDRYKAIVGRENRIAQNQLTAISLMKPGLLRKAALRTAFFVIELSARLVFRPGNLANINTIHFARWVLLPGTDRLMFFSNYGGSWESYLEDFITKARAGLTGVWSNTQGFPRARYLFGAGAADGDRFKRWARLQQIPTLFWYSAYPGVNTARVRINSAIRQGLARARSEDEARAWLDHFGSLPRPADLIEADDVQGLFFGPYGPLPEAELVAIRIPEASTQAERRDWLSYVLSRTTFGDRIPDREAMVVAFGPQGLERLGLTGSAGEDLLASFPLPFRQGMADPARSRILDDVGADAPDGWSWGNCDNPADVVISCYASGKGELRLAVADVVARSISAGFEIAERVPLVVIKKGRQAMEHFGFADGISQPVVRGTARAHGRVSPQHLVNTGEFLLGYRDERGYYPPSPTISAAYDRDSILPVSMEAGDEARGLRDIGRNGSFLVVRQLQQHVESFHGFCAAAAAAADGKVTPEWIGAKLVGRWQDGSSLVRNPHGRPSREPDNDFLYGGEDPQGTRCPLGSHIRRSNPRDSLGPDREKQVALAKRHRLLRVGRTYQSEAEKGLMFMCLNADLERQFEFVQQTWIGAGLFHGLRSEKDPLIGTQGAGARYTIPSSSGGMVLDGLPDFVTTRGGGYFFMPSRRAMQFLLSRL